MNDPRTLSLLYENIEKEYSWRIIELSNFKSNLLSENNDKALRGNLRAGIALLYAHWEGFVKQIASLYYSFVGFQSHKIEELNDAFISICIRNELNLIQDSNKLKLHVQMVRLILEEKNKVANLSSSSPIRTSNLKFEVFEDVCTLLGINTNEFEIRYKRSFDRSMQLTIDEDLVGKRNTIAHGEYLLVSKEEYKKLYDIVVNGFLFNFKEIIMDCAQNKKYLR